MISLGLRFVIEKIFDGNDIYAGLFKPEVPSMDCFVVTFSPLIDKNFDPVLSGGGWSNFREGFGEKFLFKENIKSAFVCNYTNHWWHTPELKKIASVILNDPEYMEAKKRILYGTSMGSYGALLLSQILKPDLIVCAGPRVIPSVPSSSKNKYFPEINDFDINLMEEVSKSKCAIKCFYDPLFAKDKKQFKELLNVKSVDGLEVPFSDHTPLGSLRQVGFLKNIILGLFDDSSIDNDLKHANERIERLARTTYILDKIKKSLSAGEEADIFRELALSFEFIKPEVARYFIEVAAELRPNGGYIKEIRSNIARREVCVK